MVNGINKQGTVAQSAERRPEEAGVVGSIPTGATGSHSPNGRGERFKPAALGVRIPLGLHGY